MSLPSGEELSEFMASDEAAQHSGEPNDEGLIEEPTTQKEPKEAAGGDESNPLESELDEINRFLDEADDDEPEVEASADDEDEDDELEASEEESQEPKNTKAQKRIRQLVKQRKEAQKQLQEFQYAQQQAQQQFEYQQQQRDLQWQQAFQEQQMQAAQYSQQLKMLQAKLNEVDESNLSELERYERKLARDAAQEAEKRFSPRVAQLEQQLRQMHEGKEQAQREFERNQRIEGYKRDAQNVAQQMLSTLPPEHQKDLLSDTQLMVLNYAASTGKTPEEAGRALKTWAKKSVLSELRVKAKQQRTKRDKGKAVSKSPRGTRSGVKGQPTVNYEQAQEAGYDNPLEQMLAQDRGLE